MPKLTSLEWDAQQAPFCFMHIRTPGYWKPTHFTIVEKWLNANVQGWWWHDGSTAADEKHCFVFERNADRVAFKLWISDDPFEREGGEIKKVEDEIESVVEP